MEGVHLRPHAISVLLSRALEMGPSAHSGLSWLLRLMGNMMNPIVSDFNTSQFLGARRKCVPQCVLLDDLI